MINNVSEQNKVIRNYYKEKSTGLKTNGASKSPIRAITGKKANIKPTLTDIKNEFNMFHS